MILGDSLQVMANALPDAEDLANKVQMIYLDPPYGIKLAFRISSHSLANAMVKDREQRPHARTGDRESLFRDTWTRLAFTPTFAKALRDRLAMAKGTPDGHAGSIQHVQDQR